jgi:CubicO group peptidase (beta-lactamase class C family)
MSTNDHTAIARPTTLNAILQEAIGARAFPGAVVWLAHGDRVAAHMAAGSTAYDAAFSRPVTCDTVYDIASLTKLFTATAFIIAAHETKTAVDTPVSALLPEFEVPDKCDITLHQLLNHTSGIELAVQALVEIPVHEWVTRIAQVPLKSAPGTGVLYSCTNYFLLSHVIEALSGQRLNRFIESTVLQPLGMEWTSFTPLTRWNRDSIAPTEVDSATGKPWHGIVHDEAARAVAAEGGCCGNAGLFSTAADLARFARLWLQEGACGTRQLLPPAIVRQALQDTVDAGTHRRGWCWQLDAAFFMSDDAPPGSAGHTGFTGPTLLLNPTTWHVAIVLNNRVYPTRHGPDRMVYHRRLAAWLFENSGA